MDVPEEEEVEEEKPITTTTRLIKRAIEMVLFSSYPCSLMCFDKQLAYSNLLLVELS